jgi:ArsR family transcriptional regulator
VGGQALPALEAERLAHILKAVADPVRLRLLSLIASHASGEACVCDMTGAFELTAPTISHHLKVLRLAGLIVGERRGTWVYYRAVPQLLREVSAALLSCAYRQPRYSVHSVAENGARRGRP